MVGLAAGMAVFGCGAGILEDFRNPPHSARAETWWHWMAGEVTKEGITADLEAAAKMGLGAVQLFNAGQELGIIPEERRKDCMSEGWMEDVRHAMKECKRLGLRFYAHNAPGWTGAGGPWIAPSNAMFHVETREVRVKGGEKGKIAKPDTWPERGGTYYRDIAAYAFPTPRLAMEDEFGKATVTGSDPGADFSLLWRGTDYRSHCPKGSWTPTGIEVKVAAGEEYHLEWDWGKRVTVRTVELMTKNRWGDSPELWAGDEDGKLRKVAELPGCVMTWEFFGHNLKYAVEPVTARKFRLVWRAKEGKAEETSIRRVAFSPRPGLTADRAQMGYESRTMTTGNIDLPDEAGEAVALEEVRDVTGCIGADGTLEWEAPADGRTWTLLRAGYRNKTRQVMPAPKGGRGLESDKFSKETTRWHYSQFPAVLKRLSREAGAEDAFKGILVDSYEAGPQTWTHRMAEEFRARRGYDLKKHLPAYGGYIMGNRETTRRFLRDMRQTGSDLISENFYGELRRLANADGLTLAAETCAGGAAGTFVGDGLQHHFATDLPMTESNASGAGKKMAVSAVNNAGIKLVSMEAHTGFIDWGQSLEDLYRYETWSAFADGINRIVFHATGHNPTLDRVHPGTCFGEYGCAPTRGQTWWRHSHEWLATLARTQNLLRKGLPVVDVAVYYGEDAMGPDWGLKPVGAGSESLIGMDKSPQERSGWGWDMLSPHMFLEKFEMTEGGRMAAPGGVAYRLMVLRNSRRMSPGIAEKTVRLVKEGLAVLVETVPDSAPGLEGWPRSDERVRAAMAELLGGLDGKAATERDLGKGKVMRGISIPEALGRLGVEPSFKGRQPKDANMHVRALHRREGGMDLWYVTPISGAPDAEYECSFRVKGKKPLILDPNTGEVTLPERWEERNGRVELTLRASICQPKFVVFADELPEGVAAPAKLGNTLKLEGEWKVEWEGICAPTGRVVKALADFGKSEEDLVKYFSGTMKYETTFKFDGEAAEAVLELGEVGWSADVELNGKALGVAWAHPYRVLGLAGALKRGENRLTVRVANTWLNRLAGDLKLPPEQRKAWASKSKVKAGDELNGRRMRSGLMGPVRIDWR